MANGLVMEADATKEAHAAVYTVALRHLEEGADPFEVMMWVKREVTCTAEVVEGYWGKPWTVIKYQDGRPDVLVPGEPPK